MKRVAIVDADLLGRNKHRFPNLASMKLSSFYLRGGYDTELITSYEMLLTKEYEKIIVSKVFTDTQVPAIVWQLKNVSFGGTGFYFDKAPNLPYEIEHSMPDYHLYDKWIQSKIDAGAKRNEFKEYLDYSHGFITRGCFRKCPFCVNQKYDHVFKTSPLEEFYDSSRKKICLNDDNFLAYKDWKYELEKLIDTGKPFKFKQGLDERILTPEKCKLLFSAKYDGDMTFAFDNVEDHDLIESKLKLLREYADRQFVFYVFCGFDRDNKYDESFWDKDIKDVFKRIDLLRSYHCLPYIMRYKDYDNAPDPYRGMYITLARWCNQFSFFKRNTFREYCRDVKSNGVGRSAYRYMELYERKHPEMQEELDKKIIW